MQIYHERSRASSWVIQPPLRYFMTRSFSKRGSSIPQCTSLLSYRVSPLSRTQIICCNAIMPLPDKSRYLMLHELFNQGPAK